MTAGLRRWTRRRKPNDLSHRLAAVRRHRTAHLGPVEINLLGQSRLREVVALALFLISAAIWKYAAITSSNQSKTHANTFIVISTIGRNLSEVQSAIWPDTQGRREGLPSTAQKLAIVGESTKIQKFT